MFCVVAVIIHIGAQLLADEPVQSYWPFRPAWHPLLPSWILCKHNGEHPAKVEEFPKMVGVMYAVTGRQRFCVGRQSHPSASDKDGGQDGAQGSKFFVQRIWHKTAWLGGDAHCFGLCGNHL